jgi:hypothetical protein
MIANAMRRIEEGQHAISHERCRECTSIIRSATSLARIML